jgi:hypothetical protein
MMRMQTGPSQSFLNSLFAKRSTFFCGLLLFGFAQLSLVSHLEAETKKYPLAFPPQAAENSVDVAAPDECMFLFSWAGSSEPNRNSAVPIEQMLAEEEIQQAFEKLLQLVTKSFEREAGGAREAKIISKWLPILLTHPGMLFVEDLELGGRAPKIAAGLIIDLQEDAADLPGAIEILLRNAPEGIASKLEIDGVACTQLLMEEDAPPIIYGFSGTKIIVGTSRDSVSGLLSRLKTERPEWLGKVIADSEIPRRSLTLQANIHKIFERTQVDLDSFSGSVVFGLDQLESFTLVAGFDDQGYVSKQRLSCVEGGKLGAIFSAFDKQPLTAKGFSKVPADAEFAFATKVDLPALIAIIRERTQQDAPDQLQEFEEWLADFDQEMGLSFEKEFLPAFGPGATLYYSQGEGGLSGGLTAIVDVKNAEVARKLESMIAGAWKEMSDSYRHQYSKGEWQGQTIHSLHDSWEMPFVMPSFSVTDDALIISLSPLTIKAIISRDDSFASLADAEVVKQKLGDNVIVASYVDSAALTRVLYPLIQYGAQFIAMEMRRDFQLDAGIIPSGEVLMPYLKQDLSTVEKHDDHLLIVSRSSIPATDLIATVVLPMFMMEAGFDLHDLFNSFSPGAAKIAKSQNNLKQIALGMHNYHDVFARFPGPVKSDEDKPLLSWRVQILPYIEQHGLYEQFHMDEPWDSEHNKALIAKMPDVYKSPGSKAGEGMTNYVTINDPDSAFPDGEGISLAKIRDGTSNTFMALEVSDEKAVIWTKPEDLKLDAMNPLKGIVGLRKKGFLAGLCDGSVHHFEEIDAETFRSIMTRDGREPISAWELTR